MARSAHGSRGHAAKSKHTLEQGAASGAKGKGSREPVEGSIVHW
jgi:hypothetical protein